MRLDTLYGGLTATGKQGGLHSRSLELESEEGKKYNLHALRKNAELYMEALAFQDQYIKGQFENAKTAGLLMDVYTGAHPYAPFAVTTMAEAIGLPHTNPKLVYVPKQRALRRFNVDFGNELYLLESQASSVNDDLNLSDKPKEIITTTTLLNRLRLGDMHLLDDKAYLLSLIHI